MEWLDILFTRDAPQWSLFVTFGTPHLIWIALSAAVCVWFFQVMKRIALLDKERAWNITKWLGLWCFIGWVVPAFLLVAVDPETYAKNNLPLHLCSSGGIVLPLTVLTRNKVLLNFAYGLYLPGAAAAIATPGVPYAHYSYLSLYFILFVVSHLIIIFVPLGAIASGVLQPSFRYYPAVLGIGLGLMAVDYPLNKLLDSNYLFINWPEPNTPLELFAQLAGVPGYVAVLAGFGAVVVASLFGVYRAVSLAHPPQPSALALAG
ncbi:MAG: YwaF family protein [Propionibacteriaceae bacterium]|nr:YwaF family protein [Propionibacteriaceae bacterium]